MLRPALVLSTIAFAAAPAVAADYSATLSQPSASRFIARDIVWNCAVDACLGRTENSRPVVLCQSLAKQAGRVDNFVTNGRALPPSDLDRCNASAKAAPAQAVAAKR